MTVAIARGGVVAASRRRSAVGADYASQVLSDSPILYLRCNETSGATVADSGSLGSSGTAHGTFTRNVAGAGAGTGVGITLGGANGDYISVPDNAALDLTGDFTYECWIKCASFGALHYVMSKGKTDSSNAGYSIYIFTDRSVQIWRSGASALFNAGVVYPNDTGWHHLVATRSGNTYKVYIDGAIAGTSGTVTTTIEATNADFEIGRETQTSTSTHNGQHNGSIDEIAVYGSALSAARIQAHYDARNTA